MICTKCTTIQLSSISFVRNKDRAQRDSTYCPNAGAGLLLPKPVYTSMTGINFSSGLMRMTIRMIAAKFRHKTLITAMLTRKL